MKKYESYFKPYTKEEERKDARAIYLWLFLTGMVGIFASVFAYLTFASLINFKCAESYHQAITSCILFYCSYKMFSLFHDDNN